MIETLFIDRTSEIRMGKQRDNATGPTRKTLIGSFDLLSFSYCVPYFGESHRISALVGILNTPLKEGKGREQELRHQ